MTKLNFCLATKQFSPPFQRTNKHKIVSFGYGNISLSNLPLDCIAGKHNNIISDCNSNEDFTGETIPAENVYSTNNTCVTNITDVTSIITNTKTLHHSLEKSCRERML